jgi:hypothetical protein
MTTVNPRESLLPKLNMYHTILWMNQNSQKKKKKIPHYKKDQKEERVRLCEKGSPEFCVYGERNT